MSKVTTPTIAQNILEEAAEWLMRMDMGQLSDKEHQDFMQWYKAAPEHASAWQRAEILLHKMGSLPQEASMSSLDRPDDAHRRATLLKLAGLLIAIPLGWTTWQKFTPRADYRTAVGERRDIVLADGSQVLLNTATSIDVLFDVNQRLVQVMTGEIMIETASDDASSHRPFRVTTAAGQMEALGTHFTVYHEGVSTRLRVMEGSVRITPARNPQVARVIEAGQQTSFTALDIRPSRELEASANSWSRGMLMADSMPLQAFIAELSRYRKGLLRLDPALADLRISGAFPLDNTDQVLNMLAGTHPIKVSIIVPNYWVTLESTR